MTKERAYQLRHVARGLCAICPRKLVTATRCEVHAAKQRACNRTYEKRRKRKRTRLEASWLARWLSLREGA